MATEGREANPTNVDEFNPIYNMNIELAIWQYAEGGELLDDI